MTVGQFKTFSVSQSDIALANLVNFGSSLIFKYEVMKMSNDEVDMLLEEAGIDDDETFRYEQFVDNLMNQSDDF